MGAVRHPGSLFRPLLVCGLGLLAVQAAGAAAPVVEPRIIGGTDAIDDGYGFAVQITTHLEGSSGFCGGTLLAPRWVLTAGHCVVDEAEALIDPSAFTVVTGSQELDSADGESVGVTNVYLHPDFFINSANAPYNDVALLELAQAVTVDTAIVLADEVPFAGTLATIVGWGITSNDVIELAETLQEADVPIVSNETCALEYGGLINDMTVCAGYTDREIDACIGDSGGPLMVQVDGVCEQVGIVSFGPEQCGTTYGVYTRLPNYVDWVYQYVDRDENRALAGPCSPREVDIGDDDDGGGGGAFGSWWLVVGFAGLVVLSRIGRGRGQRRTG